MSEDKFQEILDELWGRVNYYESRFGNQFEICFLVSRTAQQYRAPTILSSYTVRDPFDCYTYLLGRRVIFTDQQYIHNLVTGMPGLIEPVICCKENYIFPMEAEPGDYVIFAGNLKQVVGVNYEDGDRAINIKDVPGKISNELIIDERYIDWEVNSIDQWLMFRERRNQERDAWTHEVDNLEINEYLSSLTIT